MISHTAWAVQLLYEAASAEKVGLMLDSGLLPGLEYVRVLTPSHPRVCAGVVGAFLCAVQRRRRRHWPVRLLQAKHAESLAVAVKVARVLTRLCEQVTHAHTHERTLSHTRTHAHAFAHTHMRAPTCTHALSGRQAGKAVKITSAVHNTRAQLHAHARVKIGTPTGAPPLRSR
jgi:hypothetical protein